MAESKTTGDLSKYPLPRLLLFIQRKKFSGAMRLQNIRRTENDDTISAYFIDGKPVFVESLSKEDGLGRLLIENGVMKKEQVVDCLSSQRQTGEPFGREALNRGFIDEDILVRHLEIQQTRKFLRLFEITGGAFELEAVLPPKKIRKELSLINLCPLGLVYQGINQHYDIRRLEVDLAAVLPKALALKEEDPTFLQPVLREEDSRFVAALLKRGYWLIDDLASVAGVDRKTLLQTLYVLWAADFIKSADPDTVPRLRPKPSLKEQGGRNRRQGLTRQLAVVSPDQEGAYSSGGFSQDPHKESRSTTGEQSLSQSVSTGEYEVSEKPEVGRGVESSPISGEHGVFRGTPISGEYTAGHAAERGAPTLNSGPSRGGSVAKMKPAKKIDWPKLPDDASAAAKELDMELRSRLSAIEDQNLFEIMSLDVDCTRQDLKDAYLLLAKKFHPDRVSSLGIEVLRGPADRLFQKISEAYTTLLDDSQRAEYRAIVKDSSLAGGRQRAQQILQAELSFQKGEVFFRKGNYEQAEQMFMSALEGNPDEGEHHAMLAWTRYTAAKQRGTHHERAEELKNNLMEALRLSPRCAKASYFLGKILLDQGKQEDALPHFERAVHLNPNYVEPAREINIIKMRRAREQKPSKSSFWKRITGKNDSV